jgi:hypothetical protein
MLWPAARFIVPGLRDTKYDEAVGVQSINATVGFGLHTRIAICPCPI